MIRIPVLLIVRLFALTSLAANAHGFVGVRIAKRSTRRIGIIYSSTNDELIDDDFIQNEIDNLSYQSYHDVPWHGLDPLNRISFEDYESMYMRGKKSSLATNDEFVAKKKAEKQKHPNCDISYESVMTEWSETVPSINHFSGVGRVGYSPKATYFDNPIGGNSKPNVVVKMSMALPRYYSAWEREQEGIEYGQEETEWFNLECWGPIAEFALKFVEKGTRIGIIGSIDTDYYRNKETGILRTYPKIVVRDLDVLETKMEAEARRMRNNNSNSNSNYGRGDFNKQQPSFDDDDDDDTYNPTQAGGFFDRT